jgi:hypothetical protein
MEENLRRRRIRFSRRVVIISCVLLAAVGGLITWRVIDHALALPHASCGETVTHRLYSGTQSFRADPGALHCFGAAARTCRTASIEVVEMGVDTGTDYVFAIGPDGAACQATEWHQDYSANFGGWTGPVTSSSCRLSAVTSRGVTLNCWARDALVPATVSVIRPGTDGRSASSPAIWPPPSCGQITTSHLGSGTPLLSADPGALSCFSRAALGCMYASITVIETGGSSYAFTIEAPPKACQVTAQRRARGRTTESGCRMTTVDSRGVILLCGRQYLLIPAM